MNIVHLSRKMRSISAITALGLLLLPGVTFATSTTDYCTSLTNTHWVGTGHASGALKCEYRGDGNVGGTGNHYHINFRATKTAGGSLCPQQITNYILHFTCANNQLSANENGTTMTGRIVSPQQIRMNGKINIFDMVEVIDISANRG